jgi:hypothetical protein
MNDPAYLPPIVIVSGFAGYIGANEFVLKRSSKFLSIPLKEKNMSKIMTSTEQLKLTRKRMQDFKTLPTKQFEELVELYVQIRWNKGLK